MDAVKLYHSYFQYRYNTAIAEISWRQDINPNDTNWYIAHKNSFGSPIYLIKLVSVPFALITIVEVIQYITIGTK